MHHGGHAMVVGGVWIGIVGYLRYARGVNETISSLLMTYIGIAIMNFFVEGSLRDLTNPNKPSTMPIGDAYMVGYIPGTDVHWGLGRRYWLSVVLYILLSRTTFGFAVRVAGGNPRAALAQGLPSRQADRDLLRHRRRLRRSRRILRGCGDPGPRQRIAGRRVRLHRNPGVVPRAAQSAGHRSGRHLFGGIVASGGLIERRMGLPDATVLVLQGLTFVVLLMSETLYGRFKIFQVSGTVERT